MQQATNNTQQKTLVIDHRSQDQALFGANIKIAWRSFQEIKHKARQ
jgi:hypothetical protein